MMIALPDTSFLKPIIGEAKQLGVVVKDLDAAMRFWTDTLKVGPFVVIEEAVGDRDYMHRGKKSDVKMSLGFSYCGDLQLEFVQQLNNAPSPYVEFLEQGREGLHHIAFYPDDYEKACRDLVALGLREVAWVQTRDGQKNGSFFEGPAALGFMIELTPITPERTHYYSGFKILAETWDGSRPIRRYATRANYMASEDCRI
jgi:catechol 2,3-dioxygenase-like lactoylglutathione lyase family enzyme